MNSRGGCPANPQTSLGGARNSNWLHKLKTSFWSLIYYYWATNKQTKTLSPGKIEFYESFSSLKLLLLCGSGWPGMHYIGPGWPRTCGNSLASASEARRLQVCAHRYGIPSSLFSGLTSSQEPLSSPIPCPLPSAVLQFSTVCITIFCSHVVLHWSTCLAPCGVCRIPHSGIFEDHARACYVRDVPLALSSRVLICQTSCPQRRAMNITVQQAIGKHELASAHGAGRSSRYL